MKPDNIHMINNDLPDGEFLQAIQDEHKLALRDTLVSIHNKESQNSNYVISIFSWKVQSIAASIAIFIMVGASFLFNMNSTTTNQEIFSKYYTTENSMVTVRSTNVADFSPVNDGLKYFDQQNYQKALTTFQLAPDNVVASLYSGFSYMELKQYDQAIVAFKNIIDQKDNLFIDQAEWNLGLCYVATDNTDQAKQLLTKITNSNTIYNIRAQQLLEDMGNN
ncbi:MAG: tetratricopeptide repeat protein [Bacteroidales bacterium]|jgi:tetratricopeptide (TPR) repeat protein|nr:tetratricopeptide repeat protein [Bacteroidales bacterium]